MYGIHHKSKKATGGPVEGAGTGTSDSIKKDVASGSYIMPADSTAKLGLNPEMIRRFKESQAAEAQNLPRLGVAGRGKKVAVNLSNGEYELPPEQVHAVGVQALNQVKDATHTPVAQRGVDLEGFRRFKQQQENLPRLGVSAELISQHKARQGKEQFFANGGLVEDEPKPRQTSFDITNTPAAQRQGGVSPQGVQGMARDAASKPATGVGQPVAQKPGFGDGLAGGAKALVGAALLPHAAAADGLRYGATRAVGGDPESLEGGTGKYRDMAMGMAGEGWKQAEGASEQLRSDTREALGVKPLAKVAAQSTAPAVGAGASRPSAPGSVVQPELPRLGAPGWNKSGIGAGAQGGEIAAMVGADGVPSFTNEPGAVAGAQELPRLGVGRVGNGIGTFSQSEAGDSQLAYDRNERAIAEREKMTQASRNGAIGEGGGRVTVVADSSRAPTTAEVLRGRQDGQQAQTEALRAQTLQSGVESNQRMTTEQLGQQKLQQDLATGQFSIQDRERLNSLQRQLADPNLSQEERAAAQEAYDAMAVSPRDRLKLEQGAIGQQQKLYTDLLKAYGTSAPKDPVTGQPAVPFEEWVQPALQMLQQQGRNEAKSQPEQASRRTSVSRSEVEQTAKARGMSADEVIKRLELAGVTVSA